MAWQNKIVISESAEQEVDSENSSLKKTTIYGRKRWFRDGKDFVKYKRTAIGVDSRILLPDGNWIESRRDTSQYRIGRDTLTNFVLSARVETAKAIKKYPLVYESSSFIENDDIAAEWVYGHEGINKTFNGVFKTTLKGSNFSFKFIAPRNGKFRIVLKIAPVGNRVVSSKVYDNKIGNPYLAEWVLRSGKRLNYNFLDMSMDINKSAINLVDNTLVLPTKYNAMIAGEEFQIG